jgi:flagellar protein FliS
MEAYQKYMSSDLSTSNPIKNTIFIYQKCIGRFRLVQKLYDDYKFREGDEHLSRLETVFDELKMQINEKADEILAEYLRTLYNYIIAEIGEIKRLRTTKALPDIETILNDLIEAYSEVLKNA